MGRAFLAVDLLLLVRDTVFWDVSGDFLRFRQRTDPLVELLRGRILLFLQKDQLCGEQEAALFRQVSCRPLDCENVELPKWVSSGRSCHSPVGPGALMGDSLT